MGNLPEGFCGTPQQLAQAIADRLIIQSDPVNSSFAIGSTAPTSNVGPWLKDCSTWFVFDDATSSYVPMTFPSIASVGPGFVTAWAGQISNIPAGYLLCDGGNYLKIQYPLLYAAIGDCYAPTGPCPICDGSFYVPNICNKFIVGACVDDAGCAKSNVSDGATLLKQRDYTPHHHTGGNGVGDFALVPGGDAPVVRFLSVVDTSNDIPRAIPPFVAMPWIIKT